MERGAFLELISAIQSEFDEVAGDGVAKVLDEQAFMKLGGEDLRANMYIAVRFGSATTNYGQTSVPISLVCCGYMNRADALKSTLVEFALVNNLRDDVEVGGKYCLQLYNTPSAVQNFSEMAEGFTSLFVVSGYAVFGENTNGIRKIEYFYMNGETESVEELKFISAGFSLNVANNTQPKLASNGMATSVGQYATMTLSISTYLVESALLNALLGICSEPTSESMDDSYDLRITMADGTVIEKDWKLVSFSPSQSLGSLPMATMAFTM